MAGCQRVVELHKHESECFSCTLPDCFPYSQACPIQKLKAAKAKAEAAQAAKAKAKAPTRPRPVYRITSLLLLAVLLLLAGPEPAAAQRCFWENPCTPTAYPTATLEPGQPTPTATATPDPSASATATAAFDAESFVAPEFGLPTSIPHIDLNEAYPAPTPLQLTPIPAPSVIAIDITPPVTYTPRPISDSLTIPISITVTPLSWDSVTATYTSTQGSVFSGTVAGLESFTENIISYTNYLTGEIEAVQGTETITVITAPDWYAPDLPRPFANIGWTFEQQMDSDSPVPNYSLQSWGSLTGYMASLPFQLIRSVWDTFSAYGWIGMFLTWLLIMFILVMVAQALILALRLLVMSIRLGFRLLELAGEYIPTGG